MPRLVGQEDTMFPPQGKDWSLREVAVRRWTWGDGEDSRPRAGDRKRPSYGRREAEHVGSGGSEGGTPEPGLGPGPGVPAVGMRACHWVFQGAGRILAGSSYSKAGLLEKHLMGCLRTPCLSVPSPS